MKLMVESSVRIMSVRIGEQLLGLPLNVVRDVHDVTSIVPVPRAPDAVLGLASYRGRVTCLVSLARLLDLEPAPDARPMAVTIAWKDHAVALEVDSVEGIDRADSCLDIIQLLNSAFHPNPNQPETTHPVSGDQS